MAFLCLLFLVSCTCKLNWTVHSKDDRANAKTKWDTIRKLHDVTLYINVGHAHSCPIYTQRGHNRELTSVYPTTWQVLAQDEHKKYKLIKKYHKALRILINVSSIFIATTPPPQLFLEVRIRSETTQ